MKKCGKGMLKSQLTSHIQHISPFLRAKLHGYTMTRNWPQSYSICVSGDGRHPALLNLLQMRSALLPELMAFALDRRCALTVSGRVCLV